MLFVIISILFFILGFQFISNAKKPIFDTTKIKGKQKSGETDEEYMERLRKKSFSFGIFCVIFASFCMIFAFSAHAIFGV